MGRGNFHYRHSNNPHRLPSRQRNTTERGQSAVGLHCEYSLLRMRSGMTTESDDRTAANSPARNRRSAASSRSGTAPTYEPLWLRQPARSPNAAASAGSTDPTAPTTASAKAAPGTSRNAPFAPAPVPVRRNGFDRNTSGDDRFDRQPRARRFRRSAAGRMSGGSRRRRGKWLALVFGVLVVAVGAYGLNVATHRTQREASATAESSAAATAST